jgi:hypothetical protein
MARDNRTLKLSILADIDDLKKKLDQADKAVETNSSKIGAFTAKIGKAFLVAGAAAGAYATKLLVDGVRAAIEDEKANAKLATTLINVAGATQKTVDEVLAYSRATELATGVTEDELRPSLNRLAIATGDAQKAMELQGLALDVAAGSGKSLDAVTQALAKAYEGNTASLGRLGIGISAAELKTMSFDDITKRLSETFAGQADVAANTFEGRIARLRLAFEDVRDTLAERLLPFIERLIIFLSEKGVPALNAFIAGLTGEEGLSVALEESGSGFVKFGEFIRTVAGIISGFITLVREAIGLLVELANTGIRAVNIIKPGADVGYIPNPSNLEGLLRNPVPSVPTSTGLDRNPTARQTTVNNITVKAVDSEGAARAVAKVLTKSSARSIPALDGASIRAIARRE